MKEVFHPRCIRAITSILNARRITLLPEQLPLSEQKHTLEVKTILSLPDTVETINVQSTPSLETLPLPDVVVLPMSIQSALFFSTSQQIPQYQQPSPNNSQHPIKVFVAYASRDLYKFKRIYTMLMALKNGGGLNINVSYEELPEAPLLLEFYGNNLLFADLILLLVSDDLLATGYCNSPRMREAIPRHGYKAWIAPILLAQCSWRLAPFAYLPSILPNKGGPKPITSWRNKDEALQNISDNIVYAIDYLQNHHI